MVGSFGAAVALLGDDRPVVRPAGVYALARVATGRSQRNGSAAGLHRRAVRVPPATGRTQHRHHPLRTVVHTIRVPGHRRHRNRADRPGPGGDTGRILRAGRTPILVSWSTRGGVARMPRRWLRLPPPPPSPRCPTAPWPTANGRRSPTAPRSAGKASSNRPRRPVTGRLPATWVSA